MSNTNLVTLKARNEFEKAQIRENRDLNVSLDTKSVEESGYRIWHRHRIIQPKTSPHRLCILLF